MDFNFNFSNSEKPLQRLVGRYSNTAIFRRMNIAVELNTNC